MVRVDESDLSKEMASNSSLMFKIGCMKSDAEYLKDRAENKVKVIEANVDKRIRARANGGRKPSEDQIKKQIARNNEVKAAQEEYIEAKHKFNICWAAASSIAQKGDQLTNLAYNYRKELEYGAKGRLQRAKDRTKKLSSKRKD